MASSRSRPVLDASASRTLRAAVKRRPDAGSGMNSGTRTSVERGGDGTLQRLSREVAPRFEAQRAALAAGTTAKATAATVLIQTRIDALDLTVLKGGGKAVGDWARDHGFALTPDAP